MKNIDFIAKRKVSFIIVAIVLVIGIASFIFRGFNLDTDFIGGTTLHYRIGQTLDKATIDKIEASVESITEIKVSSIQKTGDNSDEVIIKIKELNTEIRDKVFQQLKTDYSLTDDDLLSVENIGASISKDLRNSAIFATLIAIILMLLYITIRFEFTSGMAAIACLAHDLFVMLTVYSLFQIPMNSTMIAAFLTILGYSINATIIIFDRVRENRKLQPNLKFEDNVNKSINQTLGRSINTTITTLLTIGMVFIFGVQSVREFAIPLIVGILCGLFSSVCLSGTFWSMFRKKLKSKKA